MKQPKLPVGLGVVYEGERIRRPELHLELGGPNVKQKFELFLLKPANKIIDRRVRVVGKELHQFKEGEAIPFGLLVEACGKELEKDLEPVLERRIHEFTNYIQGFMHVGSRDEIWCRISKEAARKGLRFEHVGKALCWLFKQEFKFLEKIQVTIYTDPREVEKQLEAARKVYEERDRRLRGLRDEDVDEFFSCVLCQSFAPNHVCVITPERVSLCGATSWLDARIATKIDPKGPSAPVPKGQLLDPVKGEYEGVNEAVERLSNGTMKRFFLYSMFEHPCSSCGCFEAIAFYIPEVDGIGIADRKYDGVAVNGLKFSTMAAQTGGGEQKEGLLGFGLMWMRSEKFLSADGGWERVVWMPSHLKEKFEDAIPLELREKVATEKEARSVEELRKFLEEREHPVLKRLEKRVEVKEEKPPTVRVPELPLAAPGGIRIVLKNARIYADKIIIKRGD